MIYMAHHINSLIDGNGNIAFTADAHGPQVLTGNEPDILTNYVKQLFTKAGLQTSADLQTLKPPDSRYYHNLAGDIHWGTNTVRQPPTSFDWWE